MVTAFRWSKRLSEAQQGKARLAALTDCSNGGTAEKFHSLGKTLTHGDWNEFGQTTQKAWFFTERARFFLGKKRRDFLGKFNEGLFSAPCVGVALWSLLSASLRHSKIAKVVNFIIKPIGGVKKFRSVSPAA